MKQRKPRIFRKHTSTTKAQPLLDAIRSSAGRLLQPDTDPQSTSKQPKPKPAPKHPNQGKPNAGF